MLDGPRACWMDHEHVGSRAWCQDLFSTGTVQYISSTADIVAELYEVNTSRLQVRVTVHALYETYNLRSEHLRL